ncbi:MAG: DUF421 domain-containing protein [Eubacterium sp.]
MTIIMIRSIIIYICVVTAVRIMGKRQVGQLKPHELVITILISSVATIPLQDNAIPLFNSILPILIFISLEILESALSMKSLSFRNLVQGKPIMIIKNGVLQQKEMKKLRFTMDDIIDAARQQNVFDISTIENAVIETNGTMTVQTKAEASPVTPKQLGLKVPQIQVPIAIVMDSQQITSYYSNTKKSSSEIRTLTTATNIDINDIMLLTVADDGTLYLIRKDNQ